MIYIDIIKQLGVHTGQGELQLKHHFEAGSITKIYGPSGAGKTTLLKIIAGFARPDKGIIKVDNVKWVDIEERIFLKPQKRPAGFVFQDYALFPNMTVLQHLEYGTNDKEWISKLLNIGKLETFLTRRPQYLSGGQQQRLAILRALSNKPKILLMDEPFSALDQEMKSALINDLKSLFHEMGTTVLIVSHNPGELTELAGDKLMIS
jgi:molybdate transport system ATP-binding protein